MYQIRFDMEIVVTILIILAVAYYLNWSRM